LGELKPKAPKGSDAVGGLEQAKKDKNLVQLIKNQSSAGVEVLTPNISPNPEPETRNSKHENLNIPNTQTSTLNPKP